MAYGLKYQGTQTTDRASTLTVNLYADGWAGGTTILPLMEDGAVVRPTGPGGQWAYKPLLETTATAIFRDPDGTLDAELASAGTRDFYLVILDTAQIEVPGNVVFKGWVDPLPDERDLNFPGYPGIVELVARCGLSMLKSIPFLQADGSFYTGLMSHKDLIVSILSRLNCQALEVPYFMAHRWFAKEDGLTTTGRPLEAQYIDARDLRTEKGRPIQCEAALEQLVGGKHIYVRQSCGAWHVIQQDLEFAGSYYRSEYDAAGTHVISQNFNPAQTFTDAGIRDYRELTTRQPRLHRVKTVEVVQHFGGSPNLVNNRFLEGPTRGYDRGRGEEEGGSYPDRGRDRPGGRYSGGRGPRGSTGGQGRDAGRGFTGQFDPDDTTLLSTRDWTVVGYPDIVIDEGKGPDGENVLVLAPELPVLRLDDYSSMVTDKYYASTGPRFIGGAGVQVVYSVSAYLRVRSGESPSRSLLFPVYYRIELVDAAGTAQYQLTPNETGELMAWTPVVLPAETYIPMGGRVMEFGRHGIPAGVWTHDSGYSEDTPSGTWSLRYKLSAPIDLKNVLYEGAFANGFLDSIYWASPSADLFIGGVVAPSANRVGVNKVGAAFEEDELIRDDITVYFGDTPVLGQKGSIRDSNGGPLTNWQTAPYAGIDSGKTHVQLLGEALYDEQADGVDIHRATYTRDLPYVWPHQPFELDGVRRRVGEQTYRLVRGTQGGDFIRIRQAAVAPTVDLLQDEGAASSLGGFGDAATRAYIQRSDDLFNRVLTNPIAVTNEVMGVGATEGSPATVGSVATDPTLSPIETGDGLVIFAIDGRVFEVVADENRAKGAASVAFQDIQITEPVPFPAGIFPRNAELKSIVSQTREAYLVQITGSQIARVGENVTATAITEIDLLAALKFKAARTGDFLYIGGTKVRLTADANEGDTTIFFDDPDSAPGTPITITAAINDPITAEGQVFRSEYLQNAQQITLRVQKGQVITELNVELDNINVQAYAFRSSNWDGVLDTADPNNVTIQTLGTQGWCITNSGDVDFKDIDARGNFEARDGLGNRVLMTGSGLHMVTENTNDLLFESGVEQDRIYVIEYISPGSATIKNRVIIFPNRIEVDGNKIWHAGNDGAGSGLDADTLQGSGPGAFAAAAHTHSQYNEYFENAYGGAAPGAGVGSPGDDAFDIDTNKVWKKTSASGWVQIA